MTNDELIEAVAKAIHAVNAADEPDCFGTWEEEVAREAQSTRFTYVANLRREAAAAIAAIDIEGIKEEAYSKGYRDACDKAKEQAG